LFRVGLIKNLPFSADRTNGRAYAIVLVLRPSSVSVTLCIVSKRCVMKQKLLLTTYRKSYSMTLNGTQTDAVNRL